MAVARQQDVGYDYVSDQAAASQWLSSLTPTPRPPPLTVESINPQVCFPSFFVFFCPSPPHPFFSLSFLSYSLLCLLFQVRQRLCSVVVSSSSIRGDLCVCVLCVDLVKL
jgi:hypothetical protein